MRNSNKEKLLNGTLSIEPNLNLEDTENQDSNILDIIRKEEVYESFDDIEEINLKNDENILEEKELNKNKKYNRNKRQNKKELNNNFEDIIKKLIIKTELDLIEKAEKEIVLEGFTKEELVPLWENIKRKINEISLEV